MTELDFYFDFGSPTAFLAYKRLQQLKKQYDLHITYKPMLLGGVFKATGNSSPAFIPAKGQYMMMHDLPRFQKRYGVNFKHNPHFPINTLPLMRAALAAEQLGCFDSFIEATFNAMWIDEKNMGDLEVISSVLSEAGLDTAAIFEASQSSDVKSGLIKATEEAVERGVFGAPTMFIGDEMFFGQDRLDFVEGHLK
ncbi:2-hydroxychromene-2-carboxylate isomerase [Kordiimonas sp. SCSIO 12603]|uniref:2-hydroxychromene-2-carboxylate isomerase n=1 Tax=Kordiimonas sp. SCSIO 12603 TaxID=2829596 RepID=UPI0021056687|nr:2-hydroxychromene-2-carboxylate isomerase [Kordiimonas sp. SCSIO 12603]UTW57525.1 2-hydroxychromene-2-carboxylate isomerase [Kordiimonas sp. SCSIO 12603]